MTIPKREAQKHLWIFMVHLWSFLTKKARSAKNKEHLYLIDAHF